MASNTGCATPVLFAGHADSFLDSGRILGVDVVRVPRVPDFFGFVMAGIRVSDWCSRARSACGHTRDSCLESGDDRRNNLRYFRLCLTIGLILIYEQF